MEYKHTSHVAHLIMSFLTGGLWIICWVWAFSSNQKHNARVDQWRKDEELSLLRRLVEEKERR